MKGRTSTIGVECPKCQLLNAVKEERVGGVVRCVACGGSIVVEVDDRKSESRDPSNQTALPEGAGMRDLSDVKSKRFEDSRVRRLIPKERISVEEYAEEDWTDEAGRRDEAPRKLGKVLFGAISFMIVAALIAFWRVAAISKNELVVEASPSVESVALTDALPAYDAREIAENFLYAETIDERMKWVRNSEHYADEIRDHLETIGKAEEVAKLRPQGGLDVTAGIDAMFHVAFANGNNRLVCIVRSGPSRKGFVDWEAYARRCSASWLELLSGKVTEAEVRVFVLPAQFHYFGFGEDKEEKHFAFEMTSPDCEVPVYGYVERGTRTGKVMAKILRTASRIKGKVVKRRVTLAIESVNDSYAKEKFLITRVIASGWVKSDSGDYESGSILATDGELTELEKFENEVNRKVREDRRQNNPQRGLIITPK